MQEDSETESFDWFSLEEIHHETRCTSIAIGPETSLNVPKVVKFGTAGVDFKLRIFHSNLDSKPTVQVLQGKFDTIFADLPFTFQGAFYLSILDRHRETMY